MNEKHEVEIPLKRASRGGRSATTKPDAEAPPHIPRITRLMALAVKFQEMVDRGEVRDYADLARLGYVTRARITQIMNLLNLAPEIQHDLLHLDTFTSAGRIQESKLRRIAALVSWPHQRQTWSTLFARGPLPALGCGRARRPPRIT